MFNSNHDDWEPMSTSQVPVSPQATKSEIVSWLNIVSVEGWGRRAPRAPAALISPRGPLAHASREGSSHPGCLWAVQPAGGETPLHLVANRGEPPPPRLLEVAGHRSPRTSPCSRAGNDRPGGFRGRRRTDRLTLGAAGRYPDVSKVTDDEQSAAVAGVGQELIGEGAGGGGERVAERAVEAALAESADPHEVIQ